MEWVFALYLAGMIGALIVGEFTQLAAIQFIGGLMGLGAMLFVVIALSLLAFYHFRQRRRRP